MEIGSTGCTTAQVHRERNSHGDDRQTSHRVKLCGYLKKKRNKVGWRKMWFVLQDKLLLSYSSKEEYDNKLVSFKDVLNLVPGTMVRPLGGFRFTIETTSQALYTFHCDDRSAYREWITVLLDSLASPAQHAVTQQKFAPRFCNYSMDNIPLGLARQTTTTVMEMGPEASNLGRRDATLANSFDSLSHVERMMMKPSSPPSSSTSTSASPSSALSGFVRLPIAHTTAKILERNGVNSSDLHTACSRTASSNLCAGTRNREEQRTRYTKTEMQVPSVMISSPLIAGLEQRTTLKHPAPIRDPYSTSCEPISSISRQSLSSSVPHFRLHGSNYELRFTASTAAASTATATTTASNSIGQHPPEATQSVQLINRMFSDRGACRPSVVSCTKCACETFQKAGTTSCTSECKAMGIVKDRIQRMSIKGSKDFSLDEAADAADLKNRSRLIITSSTVEELVKQQKPPPQEDAPLLEPIYAVVDLKHKYAHRRMRKSNLELKRCNSYDSLIHKTTTIAEVSKTERRGKSSSLNEPDDVDGIYEDGEKYCNNGIARRSLEEENIYEPINVTTSQQPNAFWKYFTRLKVNSLLQLTRMRKRSSDYDTIKFPTQHAAHPVGSSHFSSIKRRFGTHRKSMQLRMRKLYTRGHEPKPFIGNHGQPLQLPLQPQQLPLQPQQLPLQPQQLQPLGVSTSAANGPVANGCGKKSKYRWRSVKLGAKNSLSALADDHRQQEKRWQFGSLPHMRKARLSLFATQHLHLGSGCAVDDLRKRNV